MTATSVSITTPDGSCDAWTFVPETHTKLPCAILYMDAFGIRPAVRNMATRLAAGGYFVLLPNLYYRSGPAQEFDIAKDRDKAFALYPSITLADVMRDANAFVDFLDTEPSGDAHRLGAVGYCMGGKLALGTAAEFPDRVKAATSFHGGGLATDAPDSVHLRAARMKAAEIYVGVAANDTHFTANERIRLKDTLEEAGVSVWVELYDGAGHGFAVDDHPVYNEPAAELHWERLHDLFRRNL